MVRSAISVYFYKREEKIFAFLVKTREEIVFI